MISFVHHCITGVVGLAVSVCRVTIIETSTQYANEQHTSLDGGSTNQQAPSFFSRNCFGFLFNWQPVLLSSSLIFALGIDLKADKLSNATVRDFIFFKAVLCDQGKMPGLGKHGNSEKSIELGEILNNLDA